jgi:tetratricopeptide (TPR) repeat protein
MSNPPPATAGIFALRRELIWLPLVVLAALVIYLPGLGNPPLFDDTLLTDGYIFREYAGLLPVKERMLSYGSFVWVQAIAGEGWWKQRIVNIGLHIAVALALWAFWREMLRHVRFADDAPPAAPALGFAIGFFALNPVAVYAVAYLLQRSIVMATLFAVLALWLFAVGLARSKPWMYAAALACYVLAVLSKEYAVLVPLAAVPVYILVARPSAKRLAILSTAGLALTGLAAYILAKRYGEIIGKPFDEMSNVYLAQLAALRPGADRDAYPLSIVNQAYLFFHYGLRWLIPVSEWMSINLRPAFPLTLAAFPHVLGLVGYAATLVGGLFLVVRFRDWRALAGLAILLPALLFATEFVTVWVQDPFVLYRSYLWAVGVPGIVFLVVNGTPTRPLLVVALVAGTLLVWQALDRVFSMSSVDRAWSDAIAKLPADPRAVGRWVPYLNRGAARVDNRQYNLAMQDFDFSSRLGDMGAGLFNRGSLYLANGEHANALLTFDAAERQGYSLYNLHSQRGLSLLALGRPQEAHAHLAKALQMQPPSPTLEIVLLSLGRTSLQLGRHEEAAAHLQRLVSLQPDNGDARFYLAMALLAAKEFARALQVLEAAPKPAAGSRMHYAKALAYYGLRRRSEALTEIDAAIGLGPDTPHLREWQARIQAMK